VLIVLSLCLSWDRSRAENLAPGDELQITRLYILRWHFEQQVREFLVADPVLHEKVYNTNPEDKVRSLGYISAVLGNTGSGSRFMVQVPIPGTTPARANEWRSSRRRIERIEMQFCRDPRFLAKAVDVTGFPASEVRATSSSSCICHPLVSSARGGC